MNAAQVLAALSRWGFEPPQDAAEKIAHYYHVVSEWNARVNLTAITGTRDFLVKHVADSLWLTRYALLEGKVADVGTGAGFPGLLLKIYCPQLELTLIDSSGKRVEFLRHCCARLGIEAEIVQARAETLGHSPLRESFNWVVARALAKMPVLAEYCLPLTRRGGYFVAYKGQDGQREQAEADPAVRLLGGKKDMVKAYTLPGGENRTLLFVKKETSTPDRYPRRPGIPAKRPLN